MTGKYADIPTKIIDLRNKLYTERQKDSNGEMTVPATNVPHLVTEHSPDGFNFGYGGSGPADLALNVVEWVLRDMQYMGQKEAGKNYFIMAWKLHQDFKWDFISPMINEQNEVEMFVIREWVQNKIDKDREGWNDEVTA